MKALKSLFICTCLLLFFSPAAMAQYFDQAIGVRAGTSFELSYKRFFSYTPEIQMAWEVLGGFQLDEWKQETNGYIAEGVWYAHIDLGFDTGFSGFVGAGIFMGVYTPPQQKARFGGGISATLGASYNFTHIPLNIALDWKPILGDPRMSLARGAVTIRYVLPMAWQ